MAFPSGVEPVERIDHGGDGAVETEGKRSGAEIVVDGFRHTNDRPAFSEKLQSRGERPVTADDDEGFNFQRLHRFLCLRDDC